MAIDKIDSFNRLDNILDRQIRLLIDYIKYPFKYKVSVDTDYSILTSDSYIEANTTSNAITLTLPSASDIKGHSIKIKDISGNAGTNNITISAQNNEYIDGSSTQSISSNYGKLEVFSNGENWFLI